MSDDLKNITERISMDARLHKRLSKAVESTIERYMEKVQKSGIEAICIDEMVRDFVVAHSGLVNAALYQFLEYWFEEMGKRLEEQHAQMVAFDKEITRLQALHAPGNNDITIGELEKLEEQRILDKLEEGLD